MAGIIAAVSLMTLLFTGAGKTNTPLLPGINAKDQFPNGCIDCHKEISKTADHRLNKVVSSIEKHPNIDKIVKTVPADCSICHGKGKVPALSTITHKQHYAKPDTNVFISNYDGSCLNCHALDIASGAMRIKSGARNW